MPQPFAHALLRWQMRRQVASEEAQALRAKIAATSDPAERERLGERLTDTERRLRALGPEPNAKMG